MARSGPGGALLLVAVSSLKALLTAKTNSRRSGVRVIPISFTPAKSDVQFGLDLFESGALRPVIERTYELAEIHAAHRHVDTGRKRGAVVVRMEEGR